MPLHRGDQVGEDRLQAFPADAIGDLPEHDERLADGLGVDPAGKLGRIGGCGLGAGEEPDRVLPMAACKGGELIENLGLPTA
jgi:hypothetical protein